VSARLQSALLLVAALTTVVAVGCSSSSRAGTGVKKGTGVLRKPLGPSTAVAVFPAAGTPTASPKTQISFRGAAPAQLTGITVVGSKTGGHTGTLKDHSDGNGASFIPDNPFSEGESVTVGADPTLIGAGSSGKVRFKIAIHGSKGVPGTVRPDPGGHPDGAQDFVSRPDLHPLTVQIDKRTDKTAPGDLFLAPKGGAGQDGPMITDPKGRVIWFRQVPALKSPFDFRVQQYEGKPVLTFWQGGVHHGQGRGKGIILDDRYKTVKQVKAGNGYQADFHEFQLSKEGTAYLVIYEPVQWDLSSIGGSKTDSVLDGIVQEIDVKTGLVLFEWHSLGNIKVSESYNKPSKNAPFDITHVNSVQEETNGSLLVSSRDTHAALELDHRTGRILWRLGGKKTDYTMNPGAQFIGQHDIRRLADSRISVFDNGAPPSPGRAARAIVLNVNDATKTVSLAKSFQRSNPLHSPSQGSVQQLPNGNFMVGWGGDTPFFNEYTPTGGVALDAHLKPPSVDSYRVFRFPWTGHPDTTPDVAAVKTKKGNTTVYASWNGATEVAKWEILADGASVKTVDKNGFETHTTITGTPGQVAVRALDSNGQTLSTSSAVAPH
jgi:hypothetical protein